MRKYDFVGVALLIATAVIAAAITLDPKGFLLKDWQPLIASVIALSGASLVYRGATLAYQAAMAKVDLDREFNERTLRRHDLGIALRLHHGVRVIGHEARILRRSIPKMNGQQPTTIMGDWIKVNEPDAIVESWNELQCLPSAIGESLAAIKSHLYDIANHREILGTTEWSLKPYEAIPDVLVRVRKSADDLVTEADAILKLLDPEIKRLRRR